MKTFAAVCVAVMACGVAFGQAGELFPDPPKAGVKAGVKAPGKAPPAPAKPLPADAKVVAGAVVQGTTPDAPKAPVPDDVKVQGALYDLRDAMKVDFADGSAKGKLALASKLLNRAKGTRDVSAMRYVMYTEAARLAAAAGNVELAREATEGLTGVFAINAEEAQMKILDAMAPSTSTPEERKALAASYAALVNPTLARDDYVNAAKYNTRATNMARAAGDTDLAATYAQRGKEIAELQAEFPRVLAAMKRIAETGGNASDYTAVGTFQALLKGEFETGLPLLAKSNSPWKSLAAQDLALTEVQPKDSVALVALGDSWREAAAKLEGLAKRNATARARHSYARFLEESEKLQEQVREVMKE